MTQHLTSRLYVTDAEISERLGVCDKIGRRAIREFEKAMPGRKPFPTKDPLFGGKRYWPAVEQWLNERHGVRTASERAAVAATWEENFGDDVASRKTARAQHSRPRLASTGD